jgi:Zn-dependent protease
LFAILLGLSIHEYAHARVAKSEGDYTAEHLGRLTINPLAHIDLIGTIIVPIVLLVGSMATGHMVAFGWAKPVPVNPMAFKHPRRGVLLVSLAGPASNILLALIACLVLRAVAGPALAVERGAPLVLILTAIALINLYLAFFNLIPIPPLDGSGVVSSLLPLDLARRYESISRFGTLLILGIIVFGSFIGIGFIETVVVPPATALFRLFTGV